MFRFTHKELIKELFVQVALIARQVGQLTLDTLGFDETKIKASNGRSGSRTSKELLEAKEELSKRYDQIQVQLDLDDKEDQERMGGRLARVYTKSWRISASVNPRSTRLAQSRSLCKSKEERFPIVYRSRILNREPIQIKKGDSHRTTHRQ